jgi:hypothetical protein
MTNENQRVRQEEDRCELCGNPTVLAFEDQAICEECYQGRSSCCPEFGKDDLWVFEDEEEEPAPAPDG